MEKEQILNDTENYKIFAVSGGPDSMYMLDLFHKTYPEMKIIAAHVNYHFREDSDLDEKIVRDYCRKEHIKFRSRKIDPKVYDDLK
jgi:tRNA(Ile)-lysidine synthase